MAERILLPLDGSPGAESILPQVLRLMERRDAELVLVRAVHLIPATDVDYGLLVAELQDQAEKYVRALEKKLRAEGLRVRGIVEQGPPADIIAEAATREKATLIAMGTHGRTGLSRLIFGSVTELVLRRAPCPVFLVRTTETAAPAKAKLFSRILVPVGAGELSLRVLDVIKDFARPHDSRVLLLHVVENNPYEPHWSFPSGELKLAADRLTNATIPVQTIFRKGDAAKEILAAAKEEDADLIAMTTHGRRGIPRWVLGSVAEKVLRGATIPMLVVKAKQ
jgi:nucleotide-binding universal stress UspA family protein